MKYLILLFFNLSFFLCSFAQQYYSVECKMTVKEKITATQFSIIKGKASYNKYDDKTTIDFSFPEKVKWILTKDSLIRYDKNQVTNKIASAQLSEFSIFKLFLNGTLKNYGLQKSLYQPVNVEQNKDGTIFTTWKAPKTMKYQYGKVIVSQKDSKLQGIAFYDLKEVLISKQIFTDYVKISNLNFPTKITQINYSIDGEKYKITTFEDVIVK